MTFPETIQYLESFINYEKIPVYPYRESLKLERIKNFLASIGNPQNGLQCLHIAGTKGKGSTCAFITYILREAGYKVGLYTSPHLSDFRERIRVLSHKSQVTSHKSQIEFEGMISENELTDLVERLRPAIEKYNQNSKYGPLSFFEVYTSLAFIYFKENKVDFAVLETGLGGRLDATNVVNPLVCAITPISYEHTQKLGNTLTEIAQEKAGIIKSHQVTLPVRQAGRSPGHQLIVISASQEDEVMKVVRKRSLEANAKLFEVGKDIRYKKTDRGFEVKGRFGIYPNLSIRLLGEHQIINASVAIGVVEALRDYSLEVGINSIRDGLYNTLWPGRCEVVSRNPLIVLDGAQNVASARVLKQAIEQNFKYQRLFLVLGISQDKDISGICKELDDLADAVILTRANNPRATEPAELAKYFTAKPVRLANNVREAKKESLDLAKDEDLILVTGSLFVVGDFRDDKV